MQNLLKANKKYNEEANTLAQKITQLTKERHAKWLVNQKYLVDQADVDSTLSRQSEFCDSVILKETERITDNQRLLLECERARVEERREAFENRQKVIVSVVSDIAEDAYQYIQEQLEQMTIFQLFGRFPDFSYFSGVAYSPSLNFSKVTVLSTNDNQLKANILELVNNPKFCQKIGKTPRNIQDPQTAIGMIGIENCSLLLPILMAKPLLKWHDPVTKTIAPKLWQHMILTANVTRIRLEQSNVKFPYMGILLGVLRTISHFAIANHFSALFEDAQVTKMQWYRENHLREEYYACGEMQPDLSILPNLFTALEAKLSKKVIESIEWTPFTFPIRNALEEDLNDVPIIERSDMGTALAQAQAYAVFDTLDRSQAFVEKHKPFWFAHVQMPPEAIQKTREMNPGRISLAT